MAQRFIVERFLFLLVAFIGIILLVHTLLIKIFQDNFFVDYLTASCTSGVILLTALYIVVKFNTNVERQISNFLYFKGKQHYKILLKEAITDGLTGLYDHKYFQLRLEEELERARRYKRPLSLLMIDIDHFKRYNDAFGHPAGDKVLMKLGEAFCRFTRRVDLAARYGGEEFALILPETDKKGALIVAERVRKFVESLKFMNGTAITISVGVGCLDEAEPFLAKDELVKKADEALYRAKAAGRNRVES